VVADGTTSGLEPQLAAGRFDMAVLTLPVPGRDLTFESLFEEDLVLVVPVEEDPLVGVSRIALADLGRFELLLPAPGTAFRAEIDIAIRPAGIRLRPRAELDGVRLLASLTFEGYGPAILPATAVPPHLRPRFRLVGIDDLPPRHVVLAQRTRGMPTAGARAVIQTLRQVLADPDRVPEGVRPVLPAATTRSEGSLRVAGMPNG
jgi:DNA-binding transcriptional LysR family regulator